MISLFSSGTKFLVREDQEAAIVDGCSFNGDLLLPFNNLLLGGVLAMLESPIFQMISTKLI